MKIFIKKLIAYIAVFTFLVNIGLGVAGCDYNEIQVGDFIFEELYAGTKEVSVIGISDAGKDKEYLYIPERITLKKDEYIVTQAGYHAGWVSDRTIVFSSDNLKFLYFPWTLCPFETMVDFSAFKLERVFVACTTCAFGNGKYLRNWSSVAGESGSKDVIYSKLLFCEYFGETYEPISKNNFTCRPANIAFMFNYEGCPNNGYYSIDYLEKTGKVHEPLTPIRDGYVFGGWFADEQCTIMWNFDKTEVIIGESYQETKVYAKWIKN